MAAKRKDPTRAFSPVTPSCSIYFRPESRSSVDRSPCKYFRLKCLSIAKQKANYLEYFSMITRSLLQRTRWLLKKVAQPGIPAAWKGSQRRQAVIPRTRRTWLTILQNGYNSQIECITNYGVKMMKRRSETYEGMKLRWIAYFDHYRPWGESTLTRCTRRLWLDGRDRKLVDTDS